MLRAIGRQQKGWCCWIQRIWRFRVIRKARYAHALTSDILIPFLGNCGPLYEWESLPHKNLIYLHYEVLNLWLQVPGNLWELSRQDSYKSRFETMGLSSEPRRSGDGSRSCRVRPFWMGSLMECLQPVHVGALKIWLTPKVWWFSDLRQVTTKQCAGNKVADGPSLPKRTTFKVKVWALFFCTMSYSYLRTSKDKTYEKEVVSTRT